MRPSGVCASSCLRKSLVSNPAACTPSVSTMPGLMAFTRMLRGPSSLARVRVTASTAALLALYTALFGGERAGDRADVDDAAACTVEVRSGRLGREQHGQDVEIEHAMEALLGELLERGELVDAGVVDQDVETAEGLLRLGAEAIDLLRLRHVGRHRERPAALARDVGDHAVGALLAGGVVDDHGGAGLGQLPG